MKRTALLAGFLLLGCQQTTHEEKNVSCPEVSKGLCHMQGTEGSDVHGMIMFSRIGDAVRVEADVFNLSPGDHGFHVHQWGDISSADGSATGGHFNPSGHSHGGRGAIDRHAGDLGNLHADASGYAHLDFIDDHLKLSGDTSVVGRSIIIHAGADDFTSQPSGAAGARIAQGVIGIIK